MGQYMCGYFTSEKKISILMLGLDGSGKTTIMYRLKLGEFLQTEPTLGYNWEQFHYANIKFAIFDIHMPAPEIEFRKADANDDIRITPKWRQYVDLTEALIFVVDSSNEKVLPRAWEELHAVLNDPCVAGRKLLVLANEKNAETALTTDQLTERLGLNEIKGRNWNIQRCNAKTGDGFSEALDWFLRR